MNRFTQKNFHKEYFIGVFLRFSPTPHSIYSGNAKITYRKNLKMKENAPTIQMVKTASSGSDYSLPGECDPEKPWTLWNLNEKYTSMDKFRILVNETIPDSLILKGRDLEEERSKVLEELSPFDALKELERMKISVTCDWVVAKRKKYGFLGLIELCDMMWREQKEIEMLYPTPTISKTFK